MLQASPQKIDLQRLTADLTFQLGEPAFLHAALSVARERLGPVLPQLTPPTVQHVRVYFAGARHLCQRGPQFKSPGGLLLELLRELPSRRSHSSISPLNEK